MTKRGDATAIEADDFSGIVAKMGTDWQR